MTKLGEMLVEDGRKKGLSLTTDTVNRTISESPNFIFEFSNLLSERM